MPHKHTRREQDLSLFDLPPTRIARPLPTAPAPKKKARNQTSTTKVRPKDAPKAKPEVKADAKADGNKPAKSAEPKAAPKTVTTEKTEKGDKTEKTGKTGNTPEKPETKAAPETKVQPQKTNAKDDPRNLKRKREAAAKANKGSIAVVPTKNNDTPRAFRRLMAIAGGKRTRNGLDTGIVKETKRQKKERRAKELAVASAAAAAEAGVDGVDLKALEDAAVAPTATEAEVAAAAEKLTIRPGEKLADFNRRVDAALPLAGIVKNALPNSSGSKDPLGLAKTFRTKQERKLHKLYDQWRVDDVKLKAKLEEEKEIVDEKDAELDEEFGVKWRVDFEQPSKRAKKAKGGSGNNYIGDDIWGDFNRKRAKEGKLNAVRAGVHNSVEAPPERLTAIDSSKFNFAKKKIMDGKGKGSTVVAAASKAAKAAR
ncbi:hypothetical protein F503_04774 [Ophiostoma piceae UAMH 11346]|uniref:Uncharacterized protein n=1 Tax=Ophiostoma piceae (strain UAMH 11346) TaxID=1262450 RepID=S3BSN3_OPHP1|nr:hypothetical protein F503_04774 [Ophiostoma piceae UAMH 11346]